MQINIAKLRPILIVLALSIAAACALFFGLPGCRSMGTLFPQTSVTLEQVETVVAAEVAQVEAANQQRNADVQAAYDALAAGLISQQELQDRIAAANLALTHQLQNAIDESLTAVKDTVDAFEQDVNAQVPIATAGPVTGIPWVDLLIQVGGSIFLADRYRDYKRAKRGEPVGTAPIA